MDTLKVREEFIERLEAGIFSREDVFLFIASPVSHQRERQAGVCF